ncbi:MAG TPA: aspartate/glutamate racemase family protein [Halanaerobiales bacterium]|nr:aspartate/glutamate racemase family protein [Halanaerobiales bacterium]
MEYKAKKGQVSYGEPIGILMLDTFTPFIPGDVGNASTYDFPVRYETVEGLTVKRIFSKDKSAYNTLYTAAKNLQSQGVRAITGDCGFMAIFQNKLKEQLDVPIFLSSMLQVPFITNLISENAKIGVLSANGASLNDKNLLKEVGINNEDKIIIKGLEDKENFNKAIIEEVGILESEKVEKEVVNTAVNLVNDNPEIEVILQECSVLPPYSHAVQEATKLPVFDYITMINYVYSAVVQKDYQGIY